MSRASRDLDVKDLRYLDVTKGSTGSLGSPPFKIVAYQFGEYEITVALTPNDEFLGILEIKLNKDFVSYRKRLTPLGYHDVDEFYRD